MSRPSDYSEAIAVDICARLASGEPLVKICRDESMPGTSTVYRWLAASETFRDMYARARDDQADTLADEIVAIADEQQEVVKEDGTTYDPDVGRDKLRVDARKWVAAKLKPRKYGEKLELAGDKDNPLVIEKIERVIVDPGRA